MFIDVTQIKGKQDSSGSGDMHWKQTKYATSVVGFATVVILAVLLDDVWCPLPPFVILLLDWNLWWVYCWSMTGLLGIQDLSKPDYGDPVHLHPGDIPVFWACGVTGVEAVINCSMYSLWKL